MTRAWRLLKAKHAATAFNGEGAKLNGGRWNNIGVGVVYTSATASLALVELLVHLDSSVPLSSYVIIAIDIDNSFIERLDPAKLPPNWATNPTPPEARTYGDVWATSMRSLAIEVPSVIIPHERNYILYPEHPDFEKLVFHQPSPFPIDPRLLAP